MKKLFGNYNLILFSVILITSAGIGGIYLIAGILLQKSNDFYFLFRNFFLIFLFIIFLWHLQLFLNEQLCKFIQPKIVSIIIFILSALMGIFGMILLGANLNVFPNIPSNKPEAHAFRGFVASVFVFTFRHAAHILVKNKEIEAENEKLKRNQLENQLLQLKAQLNPHFLFNSLNTLKAMVENKDENSVEFLIKLSEVYRYFLENSEANLVTIKDELKIANAYFFMLKNRFEDNISLEIALSESDLERKMPAMSVQLLIENVVKHNVISRSKPLTIKLYLQNDILIIQNNYQPKRNPEPSTKIGLENLNNRCKILLNRELMIEKTADNFIVKLPLL